MPSPRSKLGSCASCARVATTTYRDVLLCPRCSDALHEVQAHRAATGYAFAPTQTGATIPPGLLTLDGVCRQCGTETILVRLAFWHTMFGFALTPDGLAQTERTACAECLHDMVAARPVTGVRVFARTPDQRWGELKDLHELSTPLDA